MTARATGRGGNRSVGRIPRMNRPSGREWVSLRDNRGMAWFKRQDNEIESSQEKRVRTEGLWVKCEGCGQLIFKAEMENNQQVCPQCGRHHKIDARSRIAGLLELGYG